MCLQTFVPERSSDARRFRRRVTRAYQKREPGVSARLQTNAATIWEEDQIVRYLNMRDSHGSRQRVRQRNKKSNS